MVAAEAEELVIVDREEGFSQDAKKALKRKKRIQGEQKKGGAMKALSENELAAVIVDAAFKGPCRPWAWLAREQHEAVLAYELRKRGFEVEAQRDPRRL